MSASSQSLGLGGGCSLYLRGSTTCFAVPSDANGFATLGLPVPASPSLIGGTLFAQGLVLDPLGAFGGFAFTRGVSLAVGY